jgi:hypothetical protein
LWTTVTFITLYSAFVLVPYFVSAPLLTARELGGARVWGVIVGASGVGAIIGGMLALRWSPRRPLVAAVAVTTVSAPFYALLALEAPRPLIVVAAALSGTSFPLFATLWITVMQQNVEEKVLSRVASYEWLGTVAALPVGYALVGPISSAWGQTAPLWIAVGVLLGGAGVLLAVPSVRKLRSSA